MADKTEKTVEIPLHARSFADWLIVRDDFKFSCGRLLAGKEANEPVVAIGADGATWYAWSEMDRARGDRIQVARYDEGRFDGPIAVSDRCGVEFQAALTADDDDGVWVAWSAFRDDAWHIVVRQVAGSGKGEEHIVASSQAGVFNPAIARSAKTGDLWIAWEEVVGAHSRIQVQAIAAQGEWRPGPVRTVTSEGAHAHRPVLAQAVDGRMWLAYDLFRMSNYHVFICDVTASELESVQLSRGGFQHFQPALTPDPAGGVWVAWATNENEAVRDPWHLPRWLKLSRWDGERLMEPVGKQVGKDLARVDIFQGWEFPAVVVDKAGRVWMFGQSAHTLYAQYYEGDAWSDLICYSDATWGSWKPRASAAVGPDGAIRLVVMGLQGAQAYLIDPAAEGPARAPSLKDPAKPPTASSVAHDKPSYPDVKASDGEMPLKVYFGDIHAHSVYSDGIGDIDEFYLRAAHGFGDDFAALTEHDYLDGIELSPSTYRWMCQTATRFNRLEHFVTFSGWEWTAPAIAVHAGPGQRVGEGHKHVIYPTDVGPLYSYGEPDSNSGAKFVEKMKGSGGIVIPHHIGWSGCYWDYHDPEVQRLLEICSAHGRYEYEGNEPIGYRSDQIYRENFAIRLLNDGFRFGFTGGSDGHGLLWHGTYPESNPGLARPGDKVGWKENALRSGLTAVLAPELTRAALFDALWNRRCYATSGAKIFVDFRVNDHIMGSEFVAAEPVRIDVRVIGTAALRSVEVVRNGHVMGGVTGLGRTPVSEVSFALQDPLVNGKTSAYYYVRVVQEDGEMAWSSPIWVDAPPGN